MITVDFNRLAVAPGDRILDVGCGSGRHVAEAVRIDHARVFGVDIGLADLEAARQRLRFHEAVGECRGRWALLSADIRRLPFPDAAFDLVVCSEVLEHIDDHAAAAAELVRVLKPGKHLVVSVPRSGPERICWALSKTYRSASGGHLRIYGQRELTGLFRNRGMTLWGVHFAHGLHTPYWWLRCLFGAHRRRSAILRWYHRMLVWDMMTHPPLTRRAESLLNPMIGKSLVAYFRKGLP